jgi:hypothetical protein
MSNNNKKNYCINNNNNNNNNKQLSCDRKKLQMRDYETQGVFKIAAFSHFFCKFKCDGWT